MKPRYTMRAACNCCGAENEANKAPLTMNLLQQSSVHPDAMRPPLMICYPQEHWFSLRKIHIQWQVHGQQSPQPKTAGRM